MLEIRPVCENCGKKLPHDSKEAMICTYECTFCLECVASVLHNVCPNCGGGFEKRPVRPKAALIKHPALQKAYHKPVDIIAFQPILERYRNIPSNER